MDFIINWVRYFTKEVFKTLKLVTIGTAVIGTVIFIKFKPAYEVKLAGKTIGYIDNQELIEAKISKYENDTTGNIAFREIDVLPEYELKLINRDVEISEDNVMLAIADNTKTTYKFYAITQDGEQKAIVISEDVAQNIINELKNDLNSEIDLNLGIVEVYTEDTTTTSEDDAKSILNDIKTAKVSEYETKKAAEEAEKAKKEQEEKSRKSVQYAMATASTSGDAAGAINGMSLVLPVNGSISSRFGSRSSVRSTAHTGLDFATSAGTGIRPIAAGTVTYAASKGSYGNLVIIDHGNGVQSWYAHCSAIYVSVGQSVTTSSTIAAVGSTGNSTGPHLHLEIRLNGNPVNPENYLF